MDINDCYRVLGLDIGATLDNVKLAYRDLVSVWHPDRFSNKNPRLKNTAEEKLKEINCAFDTLQSYLLQNHEEAFFNESSKSEEERFYDSQEDKHNPPGTEYPKRTNGNRLLRAGICIIMLCILGVAVFQIYHHMERYLTTLMKDSDAVKELRSLEAGIKTITQKAGLPEKSGSDNTSIMDAIGTIDKLRKTQSSSINKKQNLQKIEIKIEKNYKPEQKGMLVLLATVDESITHADQLLAAGQFNESKACYETALDMIENSDYRAAEECRGRMAQIQDRLNCSEIVYGTKGFINYHNKWISPEYYKKYFVRFKGKVLFYKELQPFLDQIADPKIRLYLMSKYKDENLHKKGVRPLELWLVENAPDSFRCRQSYEWETWSFKNIRRGAITVDMAYDNRLDRWTSFKILE